MSKLLRHLDNEVDVNRDSLSGAIARCRRAIYLSRVGDFENAVQDIDWLRKIFGLGESPSVSIWIMVAEGILYTFRDLSEEGADRLRRANALALAMRDRSLVSITSAWRAHLQFERSQFKAMSRSLQDALANAGDEERDALIRTYLVLGNAYQSCGMKAPARTSYMIAHHYALQIGDQASIDARIYNQASFAASWLRARNCVGVVDRVELDTVASELRSSLNYQTLTNTRAMENMVRLWLGRMLMLLGSYQEAMQQMESARGLLPFSPYGFKNSQLDLELACCALKLGDRSDAIERSREALRDDFADLHEDEQMVAAYLRLNLIREFGLNDLEADGNSAFEQACVKFDENCIQLREELAGLGDQPFQRLPPGIRSPLA